MFLLHSVFHYNPDIIRLYCSLQDLSSRGSYRGGGFFTLPYTTLFRSDRDTRFMWIEFLKAEN